MSHLRRLLGEGVISHRVGHGYQLQLPVQAEEAPEPTAPGPGNLPEALWPLMGREALLPALAARLQPGCHVTLLAPGGAGKTTLALAAAQQAAPAFADGVWWVDLAPLRDPAQALEGVVSQGLVNMDGGALLQARDGAAQHTLYTLHETTRLYAAGLLQASDEADAVRAALAQHLCEALPLSDASEQAADRAQAHRMLLDVEHLVEWATPHDAALAARLVEIALRAWRRIGRHALALRMATPLIDPQRTTLPPERQVALQLQLCLIDFELDDYAALMARCDVTEALLARWPDPCQHGVMLSWRGNVMGMQGDLPAAEALYRAAVERCSWPSSWGRCGCGLAPAWRWAWCCSKAAMCAARAACS